MPEIIHSRSAVVHTPAVCPCCAEWYRRAQLVKAIAHWRLDDAHPDVRCLLEALDGRSLDDLAMAHLGIDLLVGEAPRG